jgi:ACT domain-containing protein
MASIKKDIRTNQALQVIQHSNQGMTIIEACKEVGISRSTFYYFTSHNPDAIATFQEMQLVAEAQQFALILNNQFEILERVIQDALAKTTKPRQRLAIFKL